MLNGYSHDDKSHQENVGKLEDPDFPMIADGMKLPVGIVDYCIAIGQENVKIVCPKYHGGEEHISLLLNDKNINDIMLK